MSKATATAQETNRTGRYQHVMLVVVFDCLRYSWKLSGCQKPRPVSKRCCSQWRHKPDRGPTSRM